LPLLCCWLIERDLQSVDGSLSFDEMLNAGGTLKMSLSSPKLPSELQEEEELRKRQTIAEAKVTQPFSFSQVMVD
jgi:hypothetical protein